MTEPPPPHRPATAGRWTSQARTHMKAKKKQGDQQPSSEAIYRDHLHIVYRIVERMIRHSPGLDRRREEMIDAGMGSRGLEKAIKEYDPSKGDLVQHIKCVVRRAINEELKCLSERGDREIKVGLDDEVVVWDGPGEVSLDAEDDDGFTGHDLIDRDIRSPEQLSPLEELIRAEQRDILTDAVDPDLYEALLEWRDACHGATQHVLSLWADRLGFTSPDALRKALEREQAFIREKLGEDFLD